MLCSLLLAIALAAPALAVTGTTETTVAQILNSPSDFDGKLVSLRGAATSTGIGRAQFDDGTGQIGLDTDSPSPPEGDGELLALVEVPLLFGGPSLHQVWWRGSKGEREPNLTALLLAQCDLGLPPDQVGSYCDRYLLATNAPGAVARVVRVLVLGPKELPANGECRFAIGIFPQEWEKLPPRPLATTKGYSAFQRIEVAVAFPDATVAVADWPQAKACEVSSRGITWAALSPPSELTQKLGESAEAMLQIVLDWLTGGISSLADVILPFLKEEDAPPISGLTWLEFWNRYDLLAFPGYPLYGKQAVVFLLRLTVAQEPRPITAIIVKGQALFSTRLGYSSLTSQDLASFHAALPLVLSTGADAHGTLDRFLSAISRRDWDAALSYVYQQPGASEAAMRQTWTNALEGAFSETQLLRWQIRNLQTTDPDTVLATIDLILRDETGSGEMTTPLALALKRDGSEWWIASTQR